MLSSSAETVFEISKENEFFRIMISGLNTADTADGCSGIFTSTKSMGGLVGVLISFTAGSAEDSIVEI